MPSLYLIRHEEPELWGVFIGRTDPPLSTRGRAAADGKFRGLAVEVVYTSPLRRARETAAAISSPRPLVIVPELAEIGFGEWEGKTWHEIEALWPGESARKIENWLGSTAPGGESWPDFTARVRRGLAGILAGPRPAAIVAHIVVNAALAAELLGREPRQFHQNYGDVLACDC